MGIELELGILIVLQLVASSVFARFEIDTPGWQKFLKWAVIDGVTVGLYFLVGHYAILFPLVSVALALTVHVMTCRKYGVDPIMATPRENYLKMRGQNS